VLSKVYGNDCVDIAVADGDLIEFGRESVSVMTTPGHTIGCVTYVAADRTKAFTGDCLMIRGAGRTDFQSGDVHLMWHSIRDKLFTLPDACSVFPGHDYRGRTSSTIGEEKAFNPRLGGDAREEDFAGYMNNLGLPHPKLLDIAVPANQHCGRSVEADNPAEDWAPVTRTFGGILEIEPEWVARNIDELCIVDVRTSEEFQGELGHLKHSVLIPLDELRDRLKEIPDDKPVVFVCQSGMRSAMAAQILTDAGHKKVANIPGGLIHWARLALPFRDIAATAAGVGTG
jgi:rhodanese-related sulfurtransferase